ncbi:MAG: histidine kinase, partial [Flavobacteriales bacterium]
NGAGIQKFPGNAFQTFTSEDGISGKIVMDVLRDREGTLWFSTYDNGISSFDQNGVWNYYDNSNATLRNTRIWCSEKRNDGSLYFGSSGGLITNIDADITYFTKEEGLPHNQVLSLKEHNNELYIGTAKGLCKLTVNGKVEMHPASPEAKVRGIEVDALGNIWLATNRGVWKINSETQVHYTESNGLADESTYCLKVDHRGDAWVGTESGLSIISSNQVMTIPIPGGFGTNHVNFIEFDQNQTAWIGTNNGLLSSSNKTDTSEPFEWRRFGPHDGLKYLETNQNSALLENDKLFFGTSEAPVILELAELRSAHTVPVPKVVISNVKINLNNPDWSKYKVGDFSYGTWPQPLEVPYEDHHFSFNFDALSLTYPDDVMYQYKLTGVDGDWQRASEVDFTTYGNLSHDNFVFEVRAIDTFGRTSDSATFSFSVLAPIWLRWWFIALEVLLISGIIYLIYRARRRVLTNEREKEKYEYRSKMLALEQQSLNSSMNRHFIFNALNSIQYYINRQDRLSANKYLSSFAKLIRKNLDSSQNNLTSLQEEIERLELYLQLESMRFQEKFKYSIEIDDELDSNAVKVPSMMLQPFLENSIWHGILPKEELGVIMVKIEKIEADKVLFSIRDNGIGIETSLKNKSEEPDHISKGMHITSGRIDLIRKMTNQHVELIGPFEVLGDQKEVLGTEVKIVLPLELESFYTS